MGFDRTLIIDADDTNGIAATPIELTYHISEGVVHVSVADGNDDNSGISPDEAEATIQAGIATADSSYDAAFVGESRGRTCNTAFLCSDSTRQ